MNEPPRVFLRVDREKNQKIKPPPKSICSKDLERIDPAGFVISPYISITYNNCERKRCAMYIGKKDFDLA